MASNLNKLIASVKKETRHLLRDREAFLLLFVMPLIFVLIISMAMRDTFREQGGVVLPVVIIDNDRDVVGPAVIEAFSSIKAFRVETAVEGNGTTEEDIKADVTAGRHKFAVIIPRGATAGANSAVQRQLRFVRGVDAAQVKVRLIADPQLRSDMRSLAAVSTGRALQAIENRVLWERFAALAGMKITPEREKEIREILASNRPFAEVVAEDAAARAEQGDLPKPTSVQQSVPAWSLFAVFFLVIPLSVTFIKERQAGCLQRLRSMPVPVWVIMLGKAVPFFIVNQLQLILMLLAGMYIVPLLGGDRLEIGDAPVAIAMVSFAVSFAAVSYGLAVAAYCKTTEQATTFGGASIIIFGALGGIMVPKFIMPPVMQRLAVVSPMSWGLDGYLDIFVRHGSVRDILQEVAGLLVFAAAAGLIAVLRLRRTTR